MEFWNKELIILVNSSSYNLWSMGQFPVQYLTNHAYNLDITYVDVFVKNWICLTQTIIY